MKNVRPFQLYHCTTPARAKRYRETGKICQPVRGFDNLMAAMYWCMKTKRTVILEIQIPNRNFIHKLPDHHNEFGFAWWYDGDVECSDYSCKISV